MDGDLTLQQGLDIFNQKNRQYFSQRTYSAEAEVFLKCHDIAHVVFECDTTIFGEGLVKIWTTFGTTWGIWKVISGYNEVNALELFRMYSFQHVAKNIIRLLVTIPTVIIRAKRMTKPWPFSDYKNYLDTPLSEIRKRYNIQLLSPGY